MINMKTKMPALRPYQEMAVRKIKEAYMEGDRKVLLIMATGTGKTVVFAEIVKRSVATGKRVLIIAHREELLSQAKDKLAVLGVPCSIEKGQIHADPDAEVVAASIQTISSERRLHQWKPDAFDLIVIDEAHHSTADTYKRVLRYFGNAYVLGVTATPNRADKKNLSEIYTRIAFEYGLKSAIEEKYLSNITVNVVPISIDICKVPVTAGDFHAGELANAIEPYLESIADSMVSECQGRNRIIVFLPLVRIAQSFQRMLNERGFRAAEINAKTFNRAEILRDFHEGKYNVLVNAMLLTEGFDEPDVDCIICLRPTKSFGLFAQMVGRGTRLASGKKDLLLLDFLWMTKKHNLCSPAALIAPNKDIADLMMKKFRRREGPPDLLSSLKKSLFESSAREQKKFLLVKFAKDWKFEDILSYEPVFDWEKKAPTEKQIDTIVNKFGIKDIEVKSKGLASLIIDYFVRRTEWGLATFKQVNTLRRFGFENLHLWKFEEASRMLSMLAENHWTLPDGFDPKSVRFGEGEQSLRTPPKAPKKRTPATPKGKSRHPRRNSSRGVSPAVPAFRHRAPILRTFNVIEAEELLTLSIQDETKIRKK